MSAVLNMLPGMGVIVAVWILLGAVCLGLGFGVLRLVRGSIEQAEDGFAAFWIGWATMIAFLQVWQLFLPVRLPTLIVVLLAGMGCLMWAGFKPAKGKTVASKLIALGYWVAMVFFAVWLANRAMGPFYPPYDSGLYHLNAIRWMTDYAAVPGLGNLHIRLASMPSYYLYMGLLDAIPWWGRSWNLAHGLLLLVVMAQMVWSGLKVITPAKLRLYDLVALMFMPLLLKFCFLETSSMAYDLPVFLLGFVMCIQLARLLDEETSANWTVIAVTVLSAGAVAVTIKVSASVLVAATIVVMLFWAVKHGVFFWKRVTGWLLLPAFIGVVWVIRNVIFSGYPLSPSAVLSVPFEWKVEKWAMVCQMRVNMAWARDYKRPVNEVLANWDWFWPWLKGVVGFYWIEVTIPLVVFVFVVLAIGVGRMVGCWSFKRWNLLFFLPPGAALVFWLFTAPDQRFAGAAFWWLAAGAVVMLCLAQGGATRMRCWMPVLLLCVALVTWFDLRLTKYTRPGPLTGGFYPIPESKVKVFTTASGLDVFVPEKGDQVWDSPLPAMPYPNAALRLRRPGEVASGFVTGER
jgi:hypothetical protein